jgi:hypothetical protein
VKTIDANDYLNSLDNSQLERLLGSHPVTASLLQETTEATERDERKAQRELMARKRAAERDLQIPLPASVQRRTDCLADPALFLKTYFPETFSQPFTADREAMLTSIIDAAKYGGDYALAGPRGEGKTRIAMYGALYLMVAGLSPFPIIIGKSQTKAANELKTIKERLQQSELFIADFPEIGVPFQSVGGWSSRGRMQTVAGRHTNIEIAADHIIFPTVAIDQLPDGWSVPPTSCGQIISSLGVDGPIRGTNYRDRRPTLAILDDIEDKKTADSLPSIEKNELIIEKDIGGLGAMGRPVSRVMLCTTQNRKCIAYRYTDRKLKPSWKGVRYRKMIQPPDRLDLWDRYIELWNERDTDNDPDARKAWEFYFDNQQEMDRGCVMSNIYSFDKREAQDGTPIEISAIQAYFNRVARYGKDAVATEDDNDPPQSTGPQGSGLTAEIVMSRINGLARLQLPGSTRSVTAAIDLGKYACHWVVIAWFEGGGGCVVDYGVAEVQGTSSDMNHEASEPAIYRCLLNFREELMAKKLVDASGEPRKVDVCLVDSGTFTNAAYEFVRQVRHPFYASKGIGSYRQPSGKSGDVVVGDHMHRKSGLANGVDLIELDTDYWKQWTHERFMSPTFDENNMLRRGALSLFESPGKKHLSFAKHITAEELLTEFKEGKGSKTYWHVHSDTNHWLDATYNCCAAGRWTGIALLHDPTLPTVQPREVSEKPKQTKPRTVQHGQRFRTRPGGWVNGIRRR